jgi:hypothetical protein
VRLQIDPSAFARELAARLNAQLPLGTRLEVDGPILSFYGQDGRYSVTDLADSLDADDLDDERLSYLVEAMLENVQTDVAHATRGVLWPYWERGRADPLPSPWARVRQGDLSFGYGHSGPAFEPLRLSDVMV